MATAPEPEDAHCKGDPKTNKRQTMNMRETVGKNSYDYGGKRRKRYNSAGISAQPLDSPPFSFPSDDSQDDSSSDSEDASNSLWSQNSRSPNHTNYEHEGRSLYDSKEDKSLDLDSEDDILEDQEEDDDRMENVVSQGLFSKLLEHQATAKNAESSSINDENVFTVLSSTRVATKQLEHNRYTVGWICALPLEMIAARTMLDEEHLPLPNPAGDHNAYQLGAIGEHNVVITCIRSGVYGTTSATAAAIAMASTYPNSIVRPLLVGIGGGVPRPESNDVRLGDVVIGTPSSAHPAVLQYDLGKAVDDGVLKNTGTLNKPAAALLNALSLFQSELALRETRVSTYITHALESYSLSAKGFSYPGSETDILFGPECQHSSLESESRSCTIQPVTRESRKILDPVIHFGCIASGNQVIKHARTRDRIANTSSSILCFEMEAAGVMDYMPCLVVRGICDYCDAHKTKAWQGYAALAAAAVAKALLAVTPVSRSDINSIKVVTKADRRQELHKMMNPAAHPIMTPIGPSNVDYIDWDGKVERRQRILGALHFQDYNLRRATIKRAHLNTCKWLLQQSQLCEWADPTKYESHRGILWMKGKPGVGKSTVMKYLAEYTEDFYQDIDNVVIASFFFNARGEELGRSTIGMYRAILGQIFEQLPSLQSLLDSPKMANVLSQPSSWTVEVLEDLLRQVIRGLGSTYLILFIDALDECPEIQVREMVSCLAKVSELADSNHLHICFASRHYPHISLQKGCEFILERQRGHAQDILRYLNSEFVLENVELTAKLKQKMYAKSGRIFLWIVLVVQILKREFDHGGVHKLLALLDDIPAEVDELFRGILTRDTVNLPQLVIAVQWVLYAQRPLKLEELYHAMLYTTPASKLHPLYDSPATPRDMQRYILSCSKGILEQTASKNPRIQFIHETVREFLLQPAVLKGLWPGFQGIFEGSSHEFLKDSCIHYMQRAYQKAPSRAIARKLWYCPEHKFPFMSYAVSYVLYHAEQAERFEISQEDFLRAFDYECWHRLRKSVGFGQFGTRTSDMLNAADLHARELRVYKFTEPASLGLVLAITEHSRLYARWVANFSIDSNWDDVLPSLTLPLLLEGKWRECKMLLTKDYKERHPLSSTQHRVDAVCYILSKETAKSQTRSQTPSNLLDLRRTIVRVLTDLRSDKGYIIDKLNEALRQAAMYGDLKDMRKILRLGANANAQDAVLGNAAIHCTIEGVEGFTKALDWDDALLIEAPCSQTQQNKRIRYVRALCEYGADLNLKGHWGQTPLHVAVQHGAEILVNYLLDEGALTGIADVKGHTPLDYAVKLKHDKIAQLLQATEQLQ